MMGKNKCFMVLMVLALIGMSANAALIVDFYAADGFYNHVGVPTPLLSVGGSALIQLIYSPDATTDGAWDDPVNHYLDTVSGNDVWLADYTFTAATAANVYADFSAQNYSAAYSAGYIYGRIFESGTPVAGTWYYEAPVNATVDNPGAPTPATPYNFNQAGGALFPDAQVQAVPEPTTFVLALLGCIPFVVRFVRNRK